MTFIPGGSGGNGSLGTSNDVALNNPSDGHALVYDSSLGKWKNATTTFGDTARAKATVVYSSATNSYAARPSGYGTVEWMGPAEPAAGSSSEYDTWLNTSLQLPKWHVRIGSIWKAVGAGEDVVIPDGPPSTPSSLVGTVISSSQINWSWSDSAGAESYLLRVNGGTPIPVNGTTFSHINLTASTAYAAEVAAKNAHGTSAYSAAVSKTTSANSGSNVPSVPTNVTVTYTAGSDTARLSWAAPASNGGSAVTGYRLARDNGGGAESGPWSTIDPADATYRDFLYLKQGATYTFTVAAINANGDGPAEARTVTVTGSSTGAGEPTTSATGNFIERSYTRTYALTGLQEGAGGDANANGNRFRQVLAAAQPGDCITVAPGHYNLAGMVEFTVPNITLKGLGANREAVWFQHTTEYAATFRVQAGGIHFYNFTHRVNATGRSSKGQSGEGNIWAQGGHSGFQMQDVLAWGSRDSAIFVYGAHNFRFNRVESRDSKSDAYHISNGSSYGQWFDCISRNSGDDGIGIVGYGGEGPGTPHHHKVSRHRVLGQTWGRGFGIIHVNNIEYHGPTLIEDSAGASVIMARESHYGSGAVRNIRFYGELRIRRANHHESIPGHGAIMIHNDTTSGPIENIVFDGPVVIADTGLNNTNKPGSHITVHGPGAITGVQISNATFHGTGPSTLINVAAGKGVTTPGWSNSSGYSGAEPAFPKP